MESIPWYRSPVLISAAASVISQLLVLFNVADAVAPEDVEKGVNGFFQAVALLAGFWAFWKRLRSPVQPVTLKKE